MTAAPRGRCRALSRPAGLAAFAAGADLCIDTFKHAAAPMDRFRALCPFTVWPEPVIPVPGRPGQAAVSVEGVWQGLKLVDGHPDLDQFGGRPHKRPPDASRGPGYDYAASEFLLGDRVVGLLEARFAIYLPVFTYVLENLVPAAVEEEIAAVLDRGGNVAFYDWDANFDIEDCSRSFSHSALAAAWFNGEYDRYRTPALPWSGARSRGGLTTGSEDAAAPREVKVRALR